MIIEAEAVTPSAWAPFGWLPVPDVDPRDGEHTLRYEWDDAHLNTIEHTTDEIDAGECDGLTYEEISQRLPQEFSARQADKFRYRYPRGESYEDVIRRLEPVILDQARSEIRDQYLDSTKAEQRLGWRARHGLDEGLSETIAWYDRYLGATIRRPTVESCG